jgi:hypothetical protein
MLVRKPTAAALFNGEQYEFADRGGGAYAIISYDPRDREKGFEGTKIYKGAEGSETKYAKPVSLDELDFVFDRKITAEYRGDIFSVAAIEGENVTLHTSDRELGQRHGFAERDRDNFWFCCKLGDVGKIAENWAPLTKYMPEHPSPNPKS